MDAKAGRKRKVLLIHNLHFEEVSLYKVMIGVIFEVLKAFFQFNGCREILFIRSNNDNRLKAISKNFSG